MPPAPSPTPAQPSPREPPECPSPAAQPPGGPPGRWGSRARIRPTQPWQPHPPPPGTLPSMAAEPGCHRRAQGAPGGGLGSSLQPSSPETRKGWPRLERERPARLERPPTATAETPGGRKQVQEGHAEAHAPPWKNARPLQSPRTLAQCLWGPLWAAERATPRTGEGQAAPPAAPAAQPPRPGPTSDLGTWG